MRPKYIFVLYPAAIPSSAARDKIEKRLNRIWVIPFQA
jgi:hypothetical protein